MSAPAALLLFGVACAPCTASVLERQALERTASDVLTSHAFTVKPASEDAARPTGQRASPEAIDVAAKAGVDRVVVLDLESGERVLWITHFVRGFAGPWRVQQVVCARGQGRLECPELERVLSGGLRPRRAEDVDFAAALRGQAKRVGACMLEEDQRPIDERTFGRLELELQASPSGAVTLRGLTPKLVLRGRLGRCLKDAMEAMNVGAFEGDPVVLRVPVDLD